LPSGRRRAGAPCLLTIAAVRRRCHSSATALLSSFDGTNRRSVLRSWRLTEAMASHSRSSPRFHSPRCSSSRWACVPPCCGAGCLPPTGRSTAAPWKLAGLGRTWPLIWPCHLKSRFGAVRMAKINVVPSVRAALLIVSMAMNCGLISRALSFVPVVRSTGLGHFRTAPSTVAPTYHAPQRARPAGFS
jgi:hypothetical protein